MRNVMIVDNNGEYFESYYVGEYNINNEVFLNEFFSNDGMPICVPFLDSLIEFFKMSYPNNKEGLDKLMKLEDPYNIHIIYNSLLYDNMGNIKEEMKVKRWKNNKFLSAIYDTEICAENFAIFVAQSELRGFNEVSNEEYEKFIKKVLEIIEVNKEALIYDYFNTVTYYINADNIYKSNNRTEVMDIKNKYDSGEYGLFTDCIFLKEHNELPYVMFKNGLMAYVDEENNYEYYFTCANKNIN